MSNSRARSHLGDNGDDYSPSQMYSSSSINPLFKAPLGVFAPLFFSFKPPLLMYILAVVTICLAIPLWLSKNKSSPLSSLLNLTNQNLLLTFFILSIMIYGCIIKVTLDCILSLQMLLLSLFAEITPVYTKYTSSSIKLELLYSILFRFNQFIELD